MCRRIGELAHHVVESLAAGESGAPWVATTGYRCLDALLEGGLRPGHLVLVVGRPASGTSMFALGIARQAACRELVPTLLVTSDSERESAARVLAAESSTPLSRLREGKLVDEVDSLREVAARLEAAPFFVWQIDAPTDDNLLTLVSDWAVKPSESFGAARGRVVVLDLTAAGHQWSAPRLRTLRSTAARVGLAVVLVGRMSPGSHQQHDGVASRPRFADVPDPTCVDAVVTVTRPEVDDPLTSRHGEIDVEVVRNRYGPIGRRVLAALQGHYARVVEIKALPADQDERV